MSASSTFTTSTLFLRTLSRAGITHAFVNWGSDHPALLEELERQRIESGTGRTAPIVVTCPNEMVALTAAQGFAQATGKVAAVIVHVDVGTQARIMLIRCTGGSLILFLLSIAEYRHWQARCTTWIGAGHPFLSTRGRHPSARTVSTKARGTSGLCGFKVHISLFSGLDAGELRRNRHSRSECDCAPVHAPYSPNLQRQDGGEERETGAADVRNLCA